MQANIRSLQRKTRELKVGRSLSPILEPYSAQWNFLQDGELSKRFVDADEILAVVHEVHYQKGNSGTNYDLTADDIREALIRRVRRRDAIAAWDVAGEEEGPWKNFPTSVRQKIQQVAEP